MAVLSIVIPTYNRSNKVTDLLHFLLSEIDDDSIRNRVEIIVSDNCSTDDTQRAVNSFIETYSSNISIHYYRNETNIGLVGNIIVSFSHAQGQYIWGMGDDDIYHKGIVSEVLNNISGKMFTFVFINHCLYRDHIGDDRYVPSVLEGIDCNNEDQNTLLNVFNSHGAVMMYISACVFNKDSYILFKEKFSNYNLATPLLMSFFAASLGRTHYISNVLIEDKCDGNASWMSSWVDVHLYYIPEILKSLPKMGYGKWLVFKSRLLYFWKLKGAFIKKRYFRFLKWK